MSSRLNPKSFLFITLDSCRFDTFEAARTPNIDHIGRLYRAMAPGNFTFGSHMSMFVGFTPGVANLREPFVNPKYGRIFRLVGAGYPGRGKDFATMEAANIIVGFRNLGYLTVGAAAMGWFNPKTPTGRMLSSDFEHFEHTGISLDRQLDLVGNVSVSADRRPVFAFINAGETHVPYHHEGASWDRSHNPCRPFADDNDAEECRRRQTACVEWIDERIHGLLELYANANVIVTSDHGDAWGEDGLWEHGIHHDKVLEVPLVYRLAHPPD